MFEARIERLSQTVYGPDKYNSGLVAIGPALGHHRCSNWHHPEHFANCIQGMTLIDLLEMVCDWCASSERTQDVDAGVRMRRSESMLAGATTFT